MSGRGLGEKRRLELVEKLRLLRIHLQRLKGPIFISQYGPSLSRSHGQVKFNVAQRGREFFLIVPGAGAVSLEAYRDDFTALRGRV